MRWILLDNFRGFSRTLIQLRQVNFLVGENSTGKSSVLALLQLFSKADFWYEPNFNLGEVKLGTFGDIVSARATTKDHFSVGFLRDDPESTEPTRGGLTGCLMEFRDDAGLPLLRRLTVLAQDSEINVLLERSEARYKERKSSEEMPRAGVGAFWSHWLDAQQDPMPGFRAVKLPAAESGIPPLHFVMRGIEIRSARRWYLRLPWLVPFRDTTWTAPIRTKPRRTYDQPTPTLSGEGEQAPYVVRKLLDEPKRRDRFVKFIRRFGSESGLFGSLRARRYGRAPESPFSLEVMLGKTGINIANVGYGVSQCLPIIVDLFARSQKTTYLMQQPEVHLHPRAQAALGDALFYCASSERKELFVETHSDYLVDRFRQHLGRAPEDLKPSAQVLFFERGPRGNVVHPIEIRPSGGYPEDQPSGFKEFFLKEEMRLLGLH